MKQPPVKGAKKYPVVVLLLGAILAFSLVLRLWNLPSRISIGGDSGRDAFVAAYGSQALQLPLTGPFSSLGQFTFGPWYYYELIAAERITGSPYAPWVFLSLLSVATVWLTFLLGNILAGPAVGLLAALFMAISPAQLSAAKGLTNPNLISFFATGAILAFVTAWKRGKATPILWAWCLGLTLGLGANHHYQMAGMLITPLFLLLRPGMVGFVVTAYAAAFLTMLPLLFFDLNNHWYTLRHLFETYVDGKNRIYVPNRWLFYLRDFWPEFWAYTFGLPKIGAIGMIALSLGVLCWQTVRGKLSSVWKILLVLFAIQFLMLRYYWGERFMGYLQYLHPYLFLATAIVFERLRHVRWGNVLLGIALVAFVGGTVGVSLRELKPDEFSLDAGRRAETIMREYPSEKGYRIYSCSRSGWDNTQAIAYMLYIRGKLKPDGMAIGIPAVCRGNLLLPESRIMVSTLPDTKKQIANSVYPPIPHFDAVDISAASDEVRKNAGFSEVSPMTLYDSTVRWWFREQP